MDENVNHVRNHDDDDNGNVKRTIGLMSKTTINSACASRFFCTFLCLQCTTTTWNDQILSLLGNGNGKAINSTISVRTWARSSLFSSSQNPLLLSNRASLKWCEVCFSATFPWTSPLSDRKVPNDDGHHIFRPKWRWFAHAHYLVLGKFRSRSRPCLRI